ncbi:MAG TPA: hypothetical protein DCQ46_00410 [Lachnospiraceae bacterium]|nr:hypothetical protein [Lachnospiraceae bacterium]
MSKHIEVNGKLVQANKRYGDLKMKQKSQISQWLYDAYKKQVAENLSDDEALAPVFAKIDEAQIWIPEREIRNIYCSKKIKFKKRREGCEKYISEFQQKKVAILRKHLELLSPAELETFCNMLEEELLSRVAKGNSR